MAQKPESMVGLNQVFGIVAVLVLASVSLLTVKYYQGDFAGGVKVRLESARSGLLLDPGAKVSVRGVTVGRVQSVGSENGRAVLVLDIEREQAKTIPANVTVQLRPTTLFGAKFVDLVMPAQPVSQHLITGTVLTDVNASAEADQVFQNLLTILSETDPQKINGALTAVSQALGGRGEQIGETVTEFNTYLEGLLPAMPQLATDLELANQVLPSYQKLAPDVVTALNNFRTTSRTLQDQKTQIGVLLGSLQTTGGNATALLADAGPGLTGTVTQLDPVTFQLQRYAPMLSCMIKGLDYSTQHQYVPDKPGLAGNLKFLGRARPYEPVVDLPKVAEDSGPHCYGLPVIKKKLPHIDFNTGRSPFKNGVSPGSLDR